jgi:putative ABC transport system substrate-binding protein
MNPRVAPYVDRILRGANPGDLPIEQPQKFEFVVNLKTARAIGAAPPRGMLLKVDRFVE